MIALGALTVVIWLALLAARFWTTAENDEAAPRATPPQWPAVVAVVPARDEADVIARSLASLAAQDYPGDFRVILVDDNSTDGTGAIARRLGSPRIEVRSGAPLAPGWTGKLWALSQGIAAAGTPEWLWLTDADIEHAPDTLRRLVKIAHGGNRRLVSFMALLHCRTAPERPLVPAFIYFFKMLYPFGWINKTRGFMARWTGAAGGCVLVNRAALEAAGGVAAMRGALIDDCTLGALIKRQGPIWLGLSKRSRSIRPYDTAGEIAAMISRSAYAQLRYNPLLLLGTVLGLALVFMAAPALALLGHGTARLLGALAWAMMALSWLPVLAWYRRSPLWAPLLPLVAAFYGWCTIVSGIAFHRGKGGMWKGRAQAMAKA
ncbi:MAG: glycosyltransferase [Sphingomonadales bacterium]|nr:glycosyltransferase [Sphingomonadales bacterium]